MAYQKGQSGNPRGRPKKARAMTAILERAGGKSVLVGGKKVAMKRQAAAMAWEVVTTGRITFPDGAVLVADLDQWLGAIKWLYAQVDGPPPTNVKIGNGEDGAFMIGVRAVDYRSGLAALAPGPVRDSDASGEG